MIIAISPVKLMDTVTYFGNWVIKVHAGPWIGYGTVIAVVGLLSSIYHVYAAMVIGQLSNGNRFLFAFVAYAGLAIIVGALLFIIGYEMQVVLLQHNRYYSWFYIPCLIAFVVEIVLCHLVVEFILTRKLNIN